MHIWEEAHCDGIRQSDNVMEVQRPFVPSRMISALMRKRRSRSALGRKNSRCFRRKHEGQQRNAVTKSIVKRWRQDLSQNRILPKS